jgi:hypothetical protein
MNNPRDENLALIRNEQDQVVAMRTRSDAVTQLWPPVYANGAFAIC